MHTLPVQLSRHSMAMLCRLKAQRNGATLVQVIRDAIELYYFLVRRREDGASIVVADKGGFQSLHLFPLVSDSTVVEDKPKRGGKERRWQDDRRG